MPSKHDDFGMAGEKKTSDRMYSCFQISANIYGAGGKADV
jgi:hypothetical protein